MKLGKYIIEGGKNLSGKIEVQGSVSGAVTLLCGSMLCSEECVFYNCPKVGKVNELIDLLWYLGGCVYFEGQTLLSDCSALDEYVIPTDSKIRREEKLLVFAGLLANMKKARASFINDNFSTQFFGLTFTEMLEKFGAKVKSDKGLVSACAPTGLNGAKIMLATPNRTATLCAVMLGVKAAGTTTIINASTSPEIQELAESLNKTGAKIYGAGEKKIVIDGTPKLNGAERTNFADTNHSALLLTAAAITGAKVTIKGTEPTHLEFFINMLSEYGAEIVGNKLGEIEVSGIVKSKQLRQIEISEYPGCGEFFLPYVMVLLGLSGGGMVLGKNLSNLTSVCETLRQFGVQVVTDGNTAVISSVTETSPTIVSTKSLHSAETALLCALRTSGKSEIENAEIFDREFENLCGGLRKLGAEIRKVS